MSYSLVETQFRSIFIVKMHWVVIIGNLSKSRNIGILNCFGMGCLHSNFDGIERYGEIRKVFQFVRFAT